MCLLIGVQASSASSGESARRPLISHSGLDPVPCCVIRLPWRRSVPGVTNSPIRCRCFEEDSMDRRQFHPHRRRRRDRPGCRAAARRLLQRLPGRGGASLARSRRPTAAMCAAGSSATRSWRRIRTTCSHGWWTCASRARSLLYCDLDAAVAANRSVLAPDHDEPGHLPGAAGPGGAATGPARRHRAFPRGRVRAREARHSADGADPPDRRRSRRQRIRCSSRSCGAAPTARPTSRASRLQPRLTGDRRQRGAPSLSAPASWARRSPRRCSGTAPSRWTPGASSW